MSFKNFRAPLLVGTLALVASQLALAATTDQSKPVRSPEDAKKATKYEQLARMNKPRTPQQEKLVKEYMKLPPAQRNAFKAAHPDVQKSIWDLAPYAVCFYASVAGGADVVDAGDECHADWVK